MGLPPLDVLAQPLLVADHVYVEGPDDELRVGGVEEPEEVAVEEALESTSRRSRTGRSRRSDDQTLPNPRPDLDRRSSSPRAGSFDRSVDQG